MKRASGSTCLALARDAREPAEQFEAGVRRSSSCSVYLRQATERQEVAERAVGLLDRELEHLAAQRGQHDRGAWAG